MRASACRNCRRTADVARRRRSPRPRPPAPRGRRAAAATAPPGGGGGRVAHCDGASGRRRGAGSGMRVVSSSPPRRTLASRPAPSPATARPEAAPAATRPPPPAAPAPSPPARRRRLDPRGRASKREQQTMASGRAADGTRSDLRVRCSNHQARTTGEPPRLARLGRRQRRLGRETYVEGAALARPRGDAVAAQHGGQMRRELRLVRVCPMGSKTAGEYV